MLLSKGNNLSLDIALRRVKDTRMNLQMDLFSYQKPMLYLNMSINFNAKWLYGMLLLIIVFMLL